MRGGCSLDQVQVRKLCVGIFCVALAVRLTAIFVWDLHERPDPGGECEWERIAKNLATNGEFANPYWTPTGPTAHSAPAYPVLLSLAYGAAGTGAQGRLACMILNAILASLAYALLPALASLAGLSVVVGTAAALVGAIVPFRLLSELMISAGGAPLRALTWIVMHLLTLGWFRAAPVSAARWLAYGACWGAAFHVDPALLPVCLFWAAVLGWRARQQEGSSVASGLGLMLAGLSLALLPWALRNRKELGAWIFIRSNAGMELALSNNDSALPIIAYEMVPPHPEAFRQWMGRHPIGSEAQRDRIRAVGEAAYDRERLREALDWIRRNPKRFAVLSLQRFRYFWFYPGMGRRYRNVILYPMVILAGWGLLGMLRRRRFAGLLFLGDWVAYPLTYYVIQVSGRYRYPMEWTILLLSCYAVWEWWNARRQPIQPRGAVPHTRPEPHPRAA
jgi:hypothetical protein